MFKRTAYAQNLTFNVAETRLTLKSLWRRADARNVGLLTLHGGQVTLSTKSIILDCPVTLSHRRSTTVSCETYSFINSTIHYDCLHENVRRVAACWTVSQSAVALQKRLTRAGTSNKTFIVCVGREASVCR